MNKPQLQSLALGKGYVEQTGGLGVRTSAALGHFHVLQAQAHTHSHQTRDTMIRQAGPVLHLTQEEDKNPLVLQFPKENNQLWRSKSSSCSQGRGRTAPI